MTDFVIAWYNEMWLCNKIMNNIKEKILLLLLGGLAFGCSYTPHQQWKVIRAVSREWRKLNPKELRDGINYLNRLGYVNSEKDRKGITMFNLTMKGKIKSLELQLNNIRNKKDKWDGKWRMVAFDIPEKYKRGRDALRNKLKRIGFCELQKSVLITPYDCKEEIIVLVNIFELERYVRFGVLESIDNEKYLKGFFKLG